MVLWLFRGYIFKWLVDFPRPRGLAVSCLLSNRFPRKFTNNSLAPSRGSGQRHGVRNREGEEMGIVYGRRNSIVYGRPAEINLEVFIGSP